MKSRTARRESFPGDPLYIKAAKREDKIPGKKGETDGEKRKTTSTKEQRARKVDLPAARIESYIEAGEIRRKEPGSRLVPDELKNVRALSTSRLPSETFERGRNLAGIIAVFCRDGGVKRLSV